MLRIIAQAILMIALVYSFVKAFDLFTDYQPEAKATAKMIKSQNKKQIAIHEMPGVKQAIVFLSKFMYIEKTKEESLNETLIRAGIALTPKEYYARAVLGSLVGVAVLFWGRAAKMTSFTVLGAVLAIALGGYLLDETNQRLKVKDAEVKKELPRFVNTIIVARKTKSNLSEIFESYMKDAKPALRSELEKVVLEMNTGNIETALRRFDARMGADEISRLTTSLIYIENGKDQAAALQYLGDDMKQAVREARKEEHSKLPGKMRRSFLPVGLILIIIFFYAIALQIVANFTIFI